MELSPTTDSWSATFTVLAGPSTRWSYEGSLQIGAEPAVSDRRTMTVNPETGFWTAQVAVFSEEELPARAALTATGRSGQVCHARVKDSVPEA